MRITKIFSFDAAHKLPDYDGKCANLHGHRWTVELEIEGSIDKKTGMVLDFVELKNSIDPIIKKLDHHYLNDIIPNPTAENIILWLKAEISCTSLYSDLSRIRIYETPDSFAEWYT